MGTRVHVPRAEFFGSVLGTWWPLGFMVTAGGLALLSSRDSQRLLRSNSVSSRGDWRCGYLFPWQDCPVGVQKVWLLPLPGRPGRRQGPQEQYPDVGKWVLHFFCREDQISRKDDPVCVEGALPRRMGGAEPASPTWIVLAWLLKVQDRSELQVF